MFFIHIFCDLKFLDLAGTFLYLKWLFQKDMYWSPWSDQKVFGRAGHNFVALPKAKGQKESDRIMPWPDRDFQVTPWRPLFYRSVHWYSALYKCSIRWLFAPTTGDLLIVSSNWQKVDFVPSWLCLRMSYLLSNYLKDLSWNIHYFRNQVQCIVLGRS